MSPIETFDFETDGDQIVQLLIWQDEDAPSPREDDGNLGDMVCYHPRYSLGDHDFRSADDAISWRKSQYRAKTNIVIPLMIYDHGSISIAAVDSERGRNYPDQRWDCSNVGWICCDPKEARKLIGKNVHRKTLVKYLMSEVEQYNNYLTGNCYSYTVVVTEDGEEIETADSCCGFSGYDCLSDHRNDPSKDSSGLWEQAMPSIRDTVSRINKEIHGSNRTDSDRVVDSPI